MITYGADKSDGILIAGTPEYNLHLAACWSCQKNETDNTLGTQYRPHTGDSDCWCVPSSILDQCVIDRKYWRDLTEVHYVA